MAKLDAEVLAARPEEEMLTAARDLRHAIATCETRAGCDAKLVLEARYLVAAILLAVSRPD